MAQKASEVWMEHGALSYVECVGDDVPYGELTSFPRAVLAKDDEVVVFSWAAYRDRAARDDDPRTKCESAKMPFDGKRMIFGGFEPFLEV